MALFESSCPDHSGVKRNYDEQDTQRRSLSLPGDPAQKRILPSLRSPRGVREEIWMDSAICQRDNTRGLDGSIWELSMKVYNPQDDKAKEVLVIGTYDE